MHSAPAVSCPVGRSLFQAVAAGVVWLGGALACVFWWQQVQEPGVRQVLAPSQPAALALLPPAPGMRLRSAPCVGTVSAGPGKPDPAATQGTCQCALNCSARPCSDFVFSPAVGFGCGWSVARITTSGARFGARCGCVPARPSSANLPGWQRDARDACGRVGQQRR